MANYCSNWLEVSGDTYLMSEFYNSYTGENNCLDFNLITKEPSDEEYEKTGQNWYDWRIENWGNKWNPENEGYTDAEDNYYRVQFDTAWSPAEPIAKKLIDLCPALSIRLEYYEPGEGFAGEIFSVGDGQWDQYDYSYSKDKKAYYNYIYEDEKWECMDYLEDRIEQAHDDEEINDQEYEALVRYYENNNDFNLEHYIDMLIACEIL